MMNIWNLLRKKPKLSVKGRIEGCPIAYQSVSVGGLGVVCFGNAVSFGWKQSPSFNSSYAYIEARRPRSIVKIGNHCTFSNDAAIISEYEGDGSGITIGDNCVVGAGFRCYDSDFHSIYAKYRHDPLSVKTKPVQIGNGCFIGERVMVLKGSIIGDRCVIGAGSIISGGIFPDDSIIAGNPAHIIRKVEQ